MRDDSAHWMILANETIEAYEYSDQSGGSVNRAEALRLYGVANISSTGYARLDHRFILFDNFVVEPLKYTDGLTFGGTGFDPSLEYDPSPAYIGTVTAAFGVDSNATAGGFASLAEYLPALTVRLAESGYAPQVQVPQVTDFATTSGASHPYSGLEYGFLSGPDKEVIQLVYVGGQFQEKLRAALIAAGGVSTMFAETDPYLSGDMDLFCPYALYSAQYATMTSAVPAAECSAASTTNTYYYDEDDEDGVSKGWLMANILVLICSVCSFGLLFYAIALLKKVSEQLQLQASSSSTQVNKRSSIDKVVTSSGDRGSGLHAPLL
mgnify:CR=1 FL=1